MYMEIERRPARTRSVYTKQLRHLLPYLSHLFNDTGDSISTRICFYVYRDGTHTYARARKHTTSLARFVSMRT